MVSLIPNSIDTFISIQLSGHGFIGTYAVTLSSGFSFIISAQSDTSAVSEEIALGWPDSLAFNTLHHPINRVHKPRYDPLSLFVDGRIGERSRFCGESSRPCLSVEVGWEIVSQLGVRTPTIGIVHSATLGSRIRISNGMVALLSNFGNVEPKLRIPSSACESVESGMIVVSSSTLEIRDVDIVIDSLSPLFVLLSARNSSLALKEGSFIGPKSTPSSNDELSEELCSWTSGIVQLDDCNTSISDTKLNHLSFGAINMNGSLEVVTSSFHANSPTLSSFPSLSRNIHCSNGGDIEIGSLSGGDGTPTSPSPWISQNDCSLEGLESIYSTPLFVPTLNTNESKTKFAKKTETFEVEIVGTILIPCGLFLEVFEKTTDEKKENHVQFELNLDTAQSFTEKTIKLAISQGSLKKLDSSLEWRGRLLFGSRSTPTSDSTPEAGALRTSESFKIQSSISERRAESVKANMKWWLPLVISLCVVVLFLMIVVFGCWRRRGQAEKKKTSQPDAEPQEMDFEKVEDCDGSLNNTLHVSSARELNGNTRFELEQEKQGSGECKDGTEGMIPEKDRVEALCVKEGKFETVVVNKTHTLYERLHVEKVGIDRRRVASMIVRGLTELSRRGQNATGLRLSSHWVLFSESGEVCLRVKGEKEGLSEFVEKGKSEVRWRSPEQKNGEEVSGDVDAEQVTVFRLGLVLFEIETGQIPFGETDEVNASRALHCGTIPKMDGIGDEMEKLIVWCLSVTAGSRPSLRTIGSVLGSIGKMEGVGNAPSIVS
ncbi:hypothetical protein BLNAU_20103 [Blattamonas nauphoetae]|uniref:Protein kinase domain-containing protein n=1 Tax=Blattamonas nauphoetae TaxID=2049346 RepID=A0ABQ9WZU4_9EUKA|nr:hypothetical protein BLNAU_20103 [Blattamonas nauphoetae]